MKPSVEVVERYIRSRTSEGAFRVTNREDACTVSVAPNNRLHRTVRCAARR